MDDAVNVERLREAAEVEARRFERHYAATSKRTAKVIRHLLSALDAANERARVVEAEAADLARQRNEVYEDLTAARLKLDALALAAPLLEAGYAYREMVKGPTPVSPGINSFTLGNALLAAAEALPPRDGGQA